MMEINVIPDDNQALFEEYWAKRKAYVEALESPSDLLYKLYRAVRPQVQIVSPEDVQKHRDSLNFEKIELELTLTEFEFFRNLEESGEFGEWAREVLLTKLREQFELASMYLSTMEYQLEENEPIGFYETKVFEARYQEEIAKSQK